MSIAFSHILIGCLTPPETGDTKKGGFWHREDGEGLISGFYVMFVLALVLFLAVDVASYAMCSWKLHGACGEIMEMMKAENGLDAGMEARFKELVGALHMEDMTIALAGTPKTIQRGELLELRAQGQYEVRCLRPLGQSIKVPVRVRVHGLAHTYIRQY